MSIWSGEEPGQRDFSTEIQQACCDGKRNGAGGQGNQQLHSQIVRTQPAALRWLSSPRAKVAGASRLAAG